MVPDRAATWLPRAVADTLDAIGVASAYLAEADVGTLASRSSRQELQRRNSLLAQTFDSAINGSTSQRRHAEQIWPIVVATQRFADHTLAECRRHDRPVERDDGATRATLRATMTELAAAVRIGQTPSPIDDFSGPFSNDLRLLYDALTHDAK